MLLPALYVTLDDPLEFESIDDPLVVDITSCEYADVVKFDHILDSEPFSEGVLVYRDSSVVDQVRAMNENNQIGVLLLSIYQDSQLLVIIDTERELLVKNNIV